MDSSKHPAKDLAAALKQTNVNIAIVLTYTIHMHKAYCSLRYTGHESPWHLGDRRAGQMTAPLKPVHPSIHPRYIPSKVLPLIRVHNEPFAIQPPNHDGGHCPPSPCAFKLPPHAYQDSSSALRAQPCPGCHDTSEREVKKI
jgi:hypothetical protein